MTFCRVVGPGEEIRSMQESDAGRLFALVDKNRTLLRQWLPWVDRTLVPQDVQEFIRSVHEATEAGIELHAAIWIDGAIAGAAGYHTIDEANRSTSLGYWLAPQHHGRGVVTRSCAALLDYLFDERRLHRVEIRCGTGNTRSAGVPRRLGFTHEGVLRQAQCVNGRWVDLMVWSMLDQEWRKP